MKITKHDIRMITCFLAILAGFILKDMFNSHDIVINNNMPKLEISLAPEQPKVEEQKQPETIYDNEYQKMIYDVFGADEGKIMYAICRAESGLDPKAVCNNKNKSVDRGLCQINSIHKNKVNNLDDLFDPAINIKVAKQIRDEWGSFEPWVTYKTGKYLKYME